MDGGGSNKPVALHHHANIWKQIATNLLPDLSSRKLAIVNERDGGRGEEFLVVSIIPSHRDIYY